jgi:membrane protein DedA with SNARE-associated domain
VDDHDSTGPTTRPTPGRRTLVLIATPLVLLTIAANVGDALAPSLVDSHPLLLIALNARNRNLALTTNLLDPIPYYVVGFVRLVISDPLFYLLGWFYGDAAVKWVERNTKTLGSSLRWVESRFSRFALPLVFLVPNNWICLFAGASGMRPVVFIAANVSGTLVRLYVIRVLGNIFSEPIDWLLEQIATYRVPLLVLSVGAVLFTVLGERRSGRGELSGLKNLGDDLDGAGPGTATSERYDPQDDASPD